MATINPQRRITVLTVCFGLLFIGLLVRLANLQIVRGEYFEAVAENQRKRASELKPRRGTIYVSEGRRADNAEIFPIASNQTAWWAYAIPREMTDYQHTADELAPELLAFRRRQQERINDILRATGQTPRGDENNGLSETDQIDVLRQELARKFDQKTRYYEPFLRPYEVIDDKFKTFLEEKKFLGITLEEQDIRIYPEKTLAAHVLGFVGYQDEGRVGRSGIEGYFENMLAGDLGFLSTEKDTTGKSIGIAAREFRPAEDGADLVLTVDRVVQSVIEEEIKSGVEKYGAERGSILVMNPTTGAVLGMATYPTFDPNYYYAISDPRVQVNPVVSDIFEPGSILKPVVMAAAIEEQKVTPETTFADNGAVKVAEYRIDTFDGKHYGTQTMTQVLEKSNNVGMVWVAQKLGKEVMYDYFRRFGLGEKTGIELDGETQNQLKEPNKWDITTEATSSFGQGIALTPLQALNAINVLANDGQLMQPHIISKIKKSDGTEQVTEPQVVNSVVSPATANTLSAMMVSVIENGVAGLARVPGYYLAGKTGTAQVPDERGKYSLDRKIISFVGFGPVENPRFSILIKLDNPAGLSLASGTAAPMFKNIAERLLKYYQVPPSYDATIKQPQYKVSSPDAG